ncbi:MAG: hypothetical protein KJ882_04340, partial [Proteobacteria bacterium]|nr:hypothetical protein [Pseudomonadota bacterium]
MNKKGKREVTKYSIGKTSLSEFINDGWNADDPYLGKLGIVGVIHDTAVRTKKTVDIIMGFTYRSLDNRKESVLEPILKSRRAALGSELERTNSLPNNKRKSNVPA